MRFVGALAGRRRTFTIGVVAGAMGFGGIHHDALRRPSACSVVRAGLPAVANGFRSSFASHILAREPGGRQRLAVRGAVKRR